MAQWSRTDRTLHAKLVYYGPAFGGKTTNLRTLHRLVDPQGRQKLLTLSTADDRTLFFDLLPFELGDIGGYQVALKVYTVPGQVRYETTRQVVLAGADAVVFVADSAPNRQEQNQWSLQNLHLNMRARKLDPARVPIVFQYNKQDLPDAMPAAEMARALGGRPPRVGVAATAVRGQGVVETFVTAARAMIERLAALADEHVRREIQASALERHLERAFAPFLRGSLPALDPPESSAATSGPTPVLDAPVLLERAVETGVRLAEQLARESARAARLEREVEAFRRLAQSLRDAGSRLPREGIVDAALRTATEILDAPVASLIVVSEGVAPVAERTWGTCAEPLLATEKGRGLVRRLLEADQPCVVDDLGAALGDGAAGGTCACAAVPVERGTRLLLVHAARGESCFHPDDLRLLECVAGQLAVGLEKARLYEALAARHGDRP